MGLTLALFIPDAIVMASDSLAVIRNNDDGFYQDNIEKVFNVNNRFVIALEGDGFHQGLPYSFYIHKILHDKEILESNSTLELAQRFINRTSYDMSGSEIAGYIAGYDEMNTTELPTVVMIENGQLSVINHSSDNLPVYNFHTLGRNHWVNKIILPASFKVAQEVISMPSYDIDFSKYSVDSAIDFSRTMISLSAKLDYYSQLKPLIGGKIQIAVVRPFVGVTIF